jgi:hypothetical protein
VINIKRFEEGLEDSKGAIKIRKSKKDKQYKLLPWLVSRRHGGLKTGSRNRHCEKSHQDILIQLNIKSNKVGKIQHRQASEQFQNLIRKK